MTMSANFDQDNTLWDANLFPLPQSASMEFGGEYETGSMDPSFSFEAAPPYSRKDSASNAPGEPPLEWPRHQQTWPSVESTPPASEGHPRPKMLLEPRPQTQRRIRKPPSGEALERRRQQNRAAQLAFRERSKKQVEEMRLELIQCVEFNQKMQMSVRELLDRTEALKRDMEAILALQPPITSCDTSSPSRTNSMELHTSPESSSDCLN